MQESIAFNLIILLTGIVSAIMVIRPIVLWYWSISSIKKLLEEHSAQNRYVIELLQTQQKQTSEMLALMRKQVERSPKPAEPLAALPPTDTEPLL